MKLILTAALALSLTMIASCSNDETSDGNPAGQSMDNTDNGNTEPEEELNEDGTEVYNDSTGSTNGND